MRASNSSKFERPVVEGRGHAEAVLDQGLLALPVAVVHAPHLGDVWWHSSITITTSLGR